ncbi:hypothetical protein SH2C18_31370 [Clostridium sediminicola]|uniref:hypothetical protein n=1 Tax=Clostridium sediminicola TaxID=3114879 RepID=UPI0031F23245
MSIFRKVYQRYLKENGIFMDIREIANSELKRKIMIKILSNYSYYNRYILLNDLELFIDFVYCYLLNKDEEHYELSIILGSEMSGMDFYNSEEFDKSICKLLYELANTFKDISN